jgi:putative two-component system response regulator
MKIIFCEECGGKNMVEPDLLSNIANQPIVCQICDNVMSQETVFPHIRSANSFDTLRYHLLFIDDELFQLQLMKSSLEKEYIVSVASTGKHGIELAEERKPDLILLDVNMPGMDGYEVCRRLKDNKKTRHIPVIFVTSRAEKDDEEQGFKSGAVDYITKPISLQILHARLAVQIRIKQLHDRYKQQEESQAKSLQEISLWAESEQERLLQL